MRNHGHMLLGALAILSAGFFLPISLVSTAVWRTTRSCSLLGLCLGLLLASVAWGQAASPEYQILLDTDDNPATGCTVATSQGDVLGIDQRLVVTVTIGTTTATVSGIQLQNCVNGTFGPAIWTNPAG